jgi:Uma2 family endonuclease
MDTILLNTKALSMTEDEFFNLCQQNRELRMERDKDKNIVIMSPTGNITSAINLQLGIQIDQWNRIEKTGIVFDSNASFTLPNKAIRSPDVSWISKERHKSLPMEERKRFAHICPDFVIELKSDSDSLKQLKEKMEEWIENGCRLGWLIDTDERKVYVYRSNGVVLERGFDETITGEDVLPGFTLNLSFIDEMLNE